MMDTTKDRSPVETETPVLHPILVRAVVEIVLLKNGYQYDDIRSMSDLEVNVRLMATTIIRAQEGIRWQAALQK